MTLALLTPNSPPAFPSSPPTLAASPPPAPSPRAGGGTFKRVCPECGTAHLSAKRWGAFCKPVCRSAWNNRRMKRGALVYDLFMCLRNDRPFATSLRVWKVLCRLAQAFREEDLERRAGRKSWRSPEDVIAEHPWLKADVLARDMRWKRPNVR